MDAVDADDLTQVCKAWDFGVQIVDFEPLTREN